MSNHMAPAGATIEVVSVRHVENAGNLKAFATVRAGCLKLHGWRIIRQPGQRAWVSVPQELDREGRWHNQIEVTNPAVLEAIREAILHAWEAAA
jgi:DNA-binding cell septation regulator SpoVG